MLPRLRCRLCLSSRALPRPYCDGSWAACCYSAPGRYTAPSAVFRVSRAASCSAARGALTSRTPWPVGAPPFVVQVLVGAWIHVTLPLPVALLLRVPSFLVAVLPRAPAARGAPLSPMPRLGCSSALCATARGHFAACGSAALGRSSALCPFFRCCCGATCSAAPEAPLSLILGLVGAPPPLVFRLVGASLSLWVLPRLVGAPPPFVCLLVGAPLPVAVPLSFAPVLRALSRGVVVLPLARFVLGLRYCLGLVLRALVCPLCGIPWVLCCLALRRSSSLICFACCLSRLLCCLLLCCSLGSAFTHARARERSCAPCARGRFAA